MAGYLITVTGARMNIAERQYACGPMVRFTKFTSCIGVLAKINRPPGPPWVMGVHLALKEPTGFPVSAADMYQVRNILIQNHCDMASAILIGQISVWNASAPTVLIRLRQLIGFAAEYQLAEGTYGGRLDENNDLEMTY